MTDTLPGIEFNRYNSPIAQWHLWGVPQPYPWQFAVLNSCWGSGRRVACRTCNESGKSSEVIPLLACSWVSAFKGSQVVLTSGSEKQAKLQLWPAVQQMAKLKGWQMSAESVRVPALDENIPGSRIDIRVTKQGDKFEGFHDRMYIDSKGNEVLGPLLIIYDEAKSIHHDIFFAGRRCDPQVELQISTTGEDSGDFYEACMNTDGLWTTGAEWRGEHIDFKIPWTMCPHLSTPGTHKYRTRMAMLEKLGAGDPDVCSMLLAEFFRSGSWMVFEAADFECLKRATSGYIAKVGNERRAHCDLSQGRDEMTFGYRIGNQIQPIIGWHYDPGVKTRTIAERYSKEFERHGFGRGQHQPKISADNHGSGTFIVGELESMGWQIERVVPNQKAIDNASFVDRYTEKHWDYKNMIQLDQVGVPEDPQLKKEMRLRRYLRKNSNENRICMEPKEEARKKRQEPSPNRLDTAVELTDDLDVSIVTEKIRHQRASRTGTVKEYIKQWQDEEQGETMIADWW